MLSPTVSDLLPRSPRPYGIFFKYLLYLQSLFHSNVEKGSQLRATSVEAADRIDTRRWITGEEMEHGLGEFLMHAGHPETVCGQDSCEMAFIGCCEFVIQDTPFVASHCDIWLETRRDVLLDVANDIIKDSFGRIIRNDYLYKDQYISTQSIIG